MWIAHEPLRDMLADVLADAGYRVEAPTSRREALSRIARASHDDLDPIRVVLVDADGDGVVLAKVNEHLPNVAVIVFSSTLAMNVSGNAAMDNMLHVRDLLDVIEAALRHREEAPTPAA